MKLSLASLASWALFGLSSLASAERMLYSDSLNPCQATNNFSATQFDVVLTPSNNSLSFSVVGVSTIQGNITIDLVVSAYGLQIYATTLDPCSLGFTGLCPMNEGQLNLPQSNVPIPASSLANVPGIAYTVPDLDAKVKVYFNSTTTGQSAACVEASLSNGKTVDQKAVAWALAVISGLALVASAITSGLGHSNTAAHVAANALALFGYFQAQAFIGMTAVSLPPVVASWTQNFQWSMGIIRVGFLQDIATWYQRSTGGKPSSVLSSLGTTSVEVQKRSMETVYKLMKRAAYQVHDSILRARSNAAGSNGQDTANTVIVRGIQRVGFRSGIEVTNIFLTGYIFFMIFVVAVVIGVLLFKLFCELLVKMGRMKGEKFLDFRNGWTTVLKGIMFRMVLIGFPQMVVLCFWEFTQNDSTAEMVLAVLTIFAMLSILAWASSKVIRLARRSISMHKNPAYILYSDPVSLNKWGFLYVQFKATAYYFIVPFLIYILAKGLFIALGQGAGTVQAIGLVVIEAVYLITICVLRPYMDKKTNGFNIAITVINFISAVFLLVFTGIFDQPGIVTGVMGVIFFVYNAVFSTVLLLIVLIASIIAVVAKNPDTRYQPMRDDRGSFIKSQSHLNHELDALGATARGESKHGWTGGKGARIEEDEDDSWSGGSSSNERQQQPFHGQQTAYGGPGGTARSPPAQSGMPAGQQQMQASGYPASRSEQTASPYEENRGYRGNGNAASPSPWQRGAGYE
ncbi:putative flavin carrier protein 3 [Friedmanniomyces endolithicus]|nr:putative flavin carrier protein 3 [Friedmanniomyces endolithicus]